MIRPLLLFDGDCGFCRAWIARWRQYTGSAVDYAPYQDVADRFPQINPAACAEAVHMLEPDGTVTRAAEAVFRALELGGRGWGARLYRTSAIVRAWSERAYRWVAGHRGAMGRLTRWLYGRDASHQPFARANHLGLRALGAVYLVAIGSFWSQAEGLIGERGILPFAAWLEAIRPQVAQLGYTKLPTLLWLWPSDAGLHVLCAAGALGAVLLMMGVLPALMAWALWAIYLSLTLAGQIFMGFQWENLLLETGILAALAAPWRLRLRWGADPAPPRFAVFLFHALMFKLMFLSGYVKLASGDPAWRDLTALTYHYWTQPLPTWTAWYANQAPLWAQKFCCGAMFAIELALPFMIWMPRRPRQVAAAGFALLMLLIAATGNFAYFNGLTAVLCIWLVDDRAWSALLRRPERPEAIPASRAMRAVAGLAGAAIVALSASTMAAVLRWPVPWPGWVAGLHEAAAPLRSVNSYGLFAVMTKERPELAVEGSEDGVVWKAYEPKWKPGDPARCPHFVAPRQPRLDWQLWFAALGELRGNPWVAHLLGRLLEGAPSVLDLFAHNPFPERPPRYARAVLYRYRFATPAERRADGVWWVRDARGLYCPPLQLQDGVLRQVNL